MCAELGFAGYLDKPVRQSELYDTLALVMADMGRRTPAQPIITRHLAREIQRRQATLPHFHGRVLVAEDNPVNLQVTLGILKKMGLRANAVANGREALHALQTMPYDLVLMDVQMPELDGLAATREIRRLENDNAGMLECWNAGIDNSGKDGGIPDSIEGHGGSQDSKRESFRPQAIIPKGTLAPPGTHFSIPAFQHSRIPIIALTAGAMPQDQEQCFAAGMDDYVTKPVNPEELARVLARWLPKGGGRKAEDRSQESEVGNQQAGDRRQKRKSCGDLGAEIEAPSGEGVALPVFDRAALLDRCMGDEKMLQDVLHLFLTTLPQRIQDIQNALDAADAPTVRMQAHTIKGMAANTSAEALRKLAEDMENAALAGNLTAVTSTLGQLEGQLERIRQLCGKG